MPHAALDVEPALRFAENLPADCSWECRYVALLWLSILVLIPFSFTAICSEVGVGVVFALRLNGWCSQANVDVDKRLFSLGSNYLGDAALTRDAAACMLARWLSRASSAPNLDMFVTWSAQKLQSNTVSTHLVCTRVVRVCLLRECGW
jgi:hypothetical protein